MSPAEEQLREDRKLRDAARAVFLADLEHLRTSFSAKGVANRIGGRIGDGAKDVFEVAKMHADDKRGIIALIIGALALWFGRGSIMEILGLGEATDEDAALPENAQSGDDNPDDEDGEAPPASSLSSPDDGDDDEQ